MTLHRRWCVVVSTLRARWAELPLLYQLRYTMSCYNKSETWQGYSTGPNFSAVEILARIPNVVPTCIHKKRMKKILSTIFATNFHSPARSSISAFLSELEASFCKDSNCFWRRVTTSMEAFNSFILIFNWLASTFFNELLKLSSWTVTPFGRLSEWNVHCPSIVWIPWLLWCCNIIKQKKKELRWSLYRTCILRCENKH